MQANNKQFTIRHMKVVLHHRKNLGIMTELTHTCKTNRTTRLMP